jgi:vacuolar-type H+-ATPase subunit H
MQTNSKIENKNSVIFDEIKDAERKAELILKAAENEKEKLISETKNKADSMLKSALSEIDSDKTTTIKEFKSKVVILSENRLAETKETINQLEQKGFSNLQKVADFIFGKFLIKNA